MPISRPRIHRRSLKSIPTSSRPSSTIDSALAWPGSGTKPINDSPVMVLPEPDSPTSAITSPRPISRLTSRTTVMSVPSPGLGNTMSSPRRLSRGSSLPGGHGGADAALRSLGMTSPTPTRPPRASRANASRNPSPKTLNATTVRKMAIPGGMAGQIVRSMLSSASRSIRPQLAWLASAPMPRKLSAASASTAWANSNVVCTISGGATLGRMCRHMTRRSDAPAARAPST